MNDRIVRYDSSAPHNPQGLPRLPKVELEIARGQARNRFRPVAGPVFLIGTATDCDLVLGDPTFPEVHTYLFVTEEGVSIRHLGSEPAVQVSGRIVENAYLRDGERIRLGPYEFVIHIRWPQPAPECDDVPRWLEPPHGETAQAAPVPIAPEAAVQQLLREVRTLVGGGHPLLTLYVDPDSPWQSVTSAHGLSIRRQSA